MKNRKHVIRALLASSGVLVLSALSFASDAGTYVGRAMDQSASVRTGMSKAQISGRTSASFHAAYVGRRIDNPRAILEKPGIEQAELAAFEEGRPTALNRNEHSYIGRRSDALPFLSRE